MCSSCWIGSADLAERAGGLTQNGVLVLHHAYVGFKGSTGGEQILHRQHRVHGAFLQRALDDACFGRFGAPAALGGGPQQAIALLGQAIGMSLRP